jgi:hypothetical protein
MNSDKHSAKTLHFPADCCTMVSVLRRSRRNRVSKTPRASRHIATALVAQLLAGALVLLLAPSVFAAPPIAIGSVGYGADQTDAPEGVAVNQASHDVYIADGNAFRVDEYDSSGRFIRAFGFAVADGHTQALQVCTTTCFQTSQADVGAPGEMVDKKGPIAVDNSSGASSGDLYVSEPRQYRVEKYSASGEWLAMFGGGVDKGPHHPGNLCTAAYIAEGDTCGSGVAGVASGQFANDGSESLPLAVDAAGNVWAGELNRLQEFNEHGEYISEISPPTSGEVTSLGIDTDPSSSSFGDLYALTGMPGGATAQIYKLKADGTSLGTLGPVAQPRALAVDPADGDVLVSAEFHGEGTETLHEYNSSGEQVEVFGAGEVFGSPRYNALAFGDAVGDIYIAGETGNVLPEILSEPPHGPLLRSGSLIARPRLSTATLEATVNPEGATTEYRFQYISQKQFEEDGDQFGAGTAESPGASLPADFAEHVVSLPIEHLTVETDYRTRLLARNVNGEGNVAVSGPGAAESASFETLPSAGIDSEWALEVAARSVILEAQVDTFDITDEYHFEYLTEAAYKENLSDGSEPFSGASKEPIPDASIKAFEGDQGVSQYVRGLLPRTAYRYRLVAHNYSGAKAGATLSFTTQTPGSLAMLDNRVWELVSPPNKQGSDLEPIGEQGLIQASADGNALTYLANGPTEPDPEGNALLTQVFSIRGADGWASKDISIPHEENTGTSLGAGNEYRFFSEDLSRSIVQPFQPFSSFVPLSPEASEPTAYMRSDFAADGSGPCTTSSCYDPLASAANVPSGTEFGKSGIGSGTNCRMCGPMFVAANPDGSDMILDSLVPLVEGAPKESLYEWANGSLSAVNIRPESEGGGFFPRSVVGSLTGTEASPTTLSSRGAVSADGSHVFFTAIETHGNHLYLRDTASDETIRLDQVQGGTGAGTVSPVFQFASADGSRAFFTDEQGLTADAGAEGSGRGQDKPDLYECRIVEQASGGMACELSDLTPKNASGESADVLGSVIGASESGDNVYFVANGVLALNHNSNGETATQGSCPEGKGATCNLYVYHAGVTTFIAKPSDADLHDWAPVLMHMTGRVSPNGDWLAFMSDRSLTGYDNRDASSGQSDEEVFLYHAPSSVPGETGELVCASCDPTGARPKGVEFKETVDLVLAGGVGVLAPHAWIAANIPGWTPYELGVALYQSRYLSNSGRLFFDSSDDLVPQDTNGAEDVYEYEPPRGDEGAPASDTCTSDSTTYSSASAGCVDLISPGTSPEESAFLDASETGDDVFFLSSAQLSPRDADTAIDVYDARADGEEPEVARPVECQGDACQAFVAPPEQLTPGSLIHSGPGNPAPSSTRSTGVTAPKTKSTPNPRAQKLKRALRACKRDKKHAKRVVCERQAKHAYGPKAGKSDRRGER